MSSRHGSSEGRYCLPSALNSYASNRAPSASPRLEEPCPCCSRSPAKDEGDAVVCILLFPTFAALEEASWDRSRQSSLDIGVGASCPFGR